MAGIEITRTDMDAGPLRAASAKASDAKVARWIPALMLVLEGADRKAVAETCGVDRQTLRDRVYRYNGACLKGWWTGAIAVRRAGAYQDADWFPSLHLDIVRPD